MYVMFTFVPRADGGGAFPDASPTMLEICGIAPEEVRDDVAPLFRRIEPDDLAKLRGAIAQGTRDRTAWDVEFRYRHPSKGLVWMRARCTPLTGADGSLQWHGFINDITQRKRTSASWKEERELRLALLSSGTGIWSWDFATDIVTGATRSQDLRTRLRRTLSISADSFTPMTERVWRRDRDRETQVIRVEFRIIAGRTGPLAQQHGCRLRPGGAPVSMTGTARHHGAQGGRRAAAQVRIPGQQQP